MALKATIFKAELNITDLDRNYYATHALTVARHPSETDERMMLRLLAFAQQASETLEFTRGLCADDEPDLWQKNLVDEIECWIELGLPDEKRIKKACNRAASVWIYAYGGPRAVDLWLDGVRGQLSRFPQLNIVSVDGPELSALGALAERGMQLQITIQDGQLWISSAQGDLAITPRALWRDGQAVMS
ncbi:YaeQ family protein [Chitinibacter tainanensis]|uniref:YaeQ family protein n=1 Tax=Chitinibacter tainanensis TaxID=230667 RepID=UPI0004068315|nr:YaeQ family protein [Chitinibacter tainanensis]